MRFARSFAVPAVADQAFAALTDIDLAASCVPELHLDAAPMAGRRRCGTLRADLGAVAVDYRGHAWFTEVDPAARSFRLIATGADRAGSGTVSATVSGTVVPLTDEARVDLDIELQLAGRAKRLGRGALNDASMWMTEGFAHRLGARLAAHGTASTTHAGPSTPMSGAGNAAPTDGPDLSAGGERLPYVVWCGLFAVTVGAVGVLTWRRRSGRRVVRTRG